MNSRNRAVAGDCVHVTAGSDIIYRTTHVLTLPMTPSDWDKALSQTPSVTLRIYLINGSLSSPWLLLNMFSHRTSSLLLKELQLQLQSHSLTQGHRPAQRR
jgi:hypothetical protein